MLTDPNFLHQGDHAKLGGGLRSKRLHEPAAQAADLLPIDLVILSHHHGDHWDEIADRDIPKDVPIVTTAHAAKKLRRAGFVAVRALKTWESAVVRRGSTELRVTSLPGKHAPQPLAAIMPPVMGTMLDLRVGGSHRRIYVSGDTLLHERLREIPARYPDIDLALVHLGGTKVLGILLTMDGEQGAEALEMIDPDAAIPIHYEEYTVMRSPLRDFDHRDGDRAVHAVGVCCRDELRVPGARLGQVVEPDDRAPVPGVEARAAARVELGLVHLGNLRVGEHRGRGSSVRVAGREASVRRSGDRIRDDLEHRCQRVTERLLGNQESCESAECVSTGVMRHQGEHLSALAHPSGSRTGRR